MIACLFKTHLFSFIQKWGVWPLFAPLILCLHMGDEERALNSTDAMYRATLLDAVSQCYCIYLVLVPYHTCSKVQYIALFYLYSTVVLCTLAQHLEKSLWLTLCMLLGDLNIWRECFLFHISSFLGRCYFAKPQSLSQTAKRNFCFNEILLIVP